MGGTWNDLPAPLASEARQGLLIEFDHTVIRAADDQKRRDFDKRQYVAGKIRSPATGNHRANAITESARRHQSRRRTCARPEQSDRKRIDVRLFEHPAYRLFQPPGEQ